MSSGARGRARLLGILGGLVAAAVAVAIALAVSHRGGSSIGTAAASPSPAGAATASSGGVPTVTPSAAAEPSASPLPAGASTPAAGPGRTSAPSAAAAGTAPVCAPADVRLATSTDASTYFAGQDVQVTIAATNRSGHPCALPSDVEVTITNPDGTQVLDSTQSGPFADGPTWTPGQTVTASLSWNSAGGGTGGYTATATWSGLGAATATFRIASS